MARQPSSPKRGVLNFQSNTPGTGWGARFGSEVPERKMRIQRCTDEHRESELHLSRSPIPGMRVKTEYFRKQDLDLCWVLGWAGHQALGRGRKIW
jgi:hypothetical protein